MIRLANERDIDVITTLSGMISPPWSAKMITDVLMTSSADVAVYSDSESISAFICAEYILDEGCITAVVVSPDARRRGIACSLIKYIERLRQKRNIYLEVNENNLQAIALYKKCGYTETGKRKNYYGKDAAIIMNKEF